MLVVAGAVLLLDQVTKQWAVHGLSDGPVGLIDGLLQLRLTENPGAAFSSFQGAGSLLAIVAGVVASWIVIMIRRSTRVLEGVALALVLGGAVGNLLDRVVRGDGWLDGAVVDFVDPSFFPTFNVADSAITVGAVLLVAAVIRHDGEREPAPGGEPGDGAG